MGRIYLYAALAIITLAGFLMGHFIKITGYQVQTGNFTANVISAVACTFSSHALNITFGDDIDPGKAYNATRNFVDNLNHSWHNITIDSTSTVNANLSLKGNDFISGGNVIGIGNVSWGSNTTHQNGTNMVYPGTANISTSYDATNLIDSNEEPGSPVWHRMWLNIPSGTTAGQYKGNYTIRCVEA